MIYEMGLDYVQICRRKGFEAVWQAESRLVRDAIVPMAAYAAVTEQNTYWFWCNKQLDSKYWSC